MNQNRCEGGKMQIRMEIDQPKKMDLILSTPSPPPLTFAICLDDTVLPFKKIKQGRN